jgi:hypothetical protein
MKTLFSGNITIPFFFLCLFVFLSRIPFLWAGYGSEEDAWLLPLTAKNIAVNGIYEMSRAPGHPLQELIYSLMWNASPFAYNLLGAIASVVAVIFFALSLRNLNVKHYLFASFAFAFTPVVFISSTYTIDYMFAMAFVMGSFYCITSPLPPLRGERGVRGEVMGALLLGIAIGFRLTSAAMLIPFCIWLFPTTKGGHKKIYVFCTTTIIIGFLAYLPVLKTYGLSFFTYSDQFPYPNIPKVLYKMTFGVFGAIGIIAIIFFKINILLRKFSKKEKLLPSRVHQKVCWVSVTAIIIYLISYFRLPQKSGYIIPMVPFIILLFGYSLSSRAFKIFCVSIILSSFVFSINLTDPFRGSSHSALSFTFTLAGQEIFIDPLTGPVFADYTKRLNKIAFTEQVYQRTMRENRKIVLICGWWYNELLVRNWNSQQNRNVLPVFYIDKPTMEKYNSEGYEIYYLPEQNLYNDQFSQMDCTDSFSKRYL